MSIWSSSPSSVSLGCGLSPLSLDLLGLAISPINLQVQCMREMTMYMQKKC